MNESRQQTLPVAIIGGGPVGLAAAAQLLTKGEEFILFESGSSIGSSVLEWGHVRMFSPWHYNIDRAAKEFLLKSGWSPPNEEEPPTGRELVNDYLLPLSHLPEMKTKIYLNAKVVGVARKGLDKLKTAQRENAPFQVYVEIDGETKVFEARAVIDSSGTWRHPNPILSNGLWTKAEKMLENRIYYGIPNVKELESRYKDKAVMVIGSGHSAINALLELADLKGKFPETQIYWAMRKKRVQEVYGGQENDGLPARGELGIKIQKLVDTHQINILTPFYIHGVSETDGKIIVTGDLKGEEVSINGIDEVVVSTGFRPDTRFLQEVRLSTDPAVESVEALAPLIDPNIHSCGTVRPHGEAELRQPEKNFYIVGMKSYGRAPTFLLATGYEQVRSVVAYLTGDFEGAKEVQLELPETGVCRTNLASCCEPSSPAQQPTSSCCGGPVKIEITRSSCCG
ncbi:NAD(P)-binding domain-containing protein [Peribacillus kribbensis]|uniref:NAD(P)-binding domain-containing protein n=1 Tax=Peribacillus kribbensis TaxID=356658 RepID=UPI0004158F76|nr:NAD(P)-binding domain-containing protein [Peribacillus kribbensis]